jgi:hypothetical protein
VCEISALPHACSAGPCQPEVSPCNHNPRISRPLLQGEARRAMGSGRQMGFGLLDPGPPVRTRFGAGPGVGIAGLVRASPKRNSPPLRPGNADVGRRFRPLTTSTIRRSTPSHQQRTFRGRVAQDSVQLRKMACRAAAGIDICMAVQGHRLAQEGHPTGCPFYKTRCPLIPKTSTWRGFGRKQQKVHENCLTRVPHAWRKASGATPAKAPARNLSSPSIGAHYPGVF